MTIRLNLLTILPLACLSLISGCDTIGFNQDSQDVSSLPESITILEEFSVASTPCSTVGGFRLVHGLDHNHDGKLSPYERQHEDYVCHPGSTLESKKAVASLPGIKQTIE